MLEIFHERRGFILRAADSGIHHDQYLGFVYTKDEINGTIRRNPSTIDKAVGLIVSLFSTSWEYWLLT